MSKPGKRHAALQPLSWHHHHALVLARALVQQTEPRQVLKDRVQLFWEHGGREHFREEEELLLPEFAKVASLDQPEIHELLMEHVKIRSLISEICDDNRTEKISELGQLMKTHIQKEERVVFPLIESKLSEEQLQQLAPNLSDHPT